jgi:hypothetical protein
MSFFSNTDTGSIVTRYEATLHRVEPSLTSFRFSQDMQLIDGSLPLALMAVAASRFR